MLHPFERFIAFRYLRARKREGFLSVMGWFSLLGIALGVATLIIVMSVMNGFRDELFSRILGVGSHVALYDTAHQMSDYEDLSRRLQALPFVKQALPVIDGQVMITRQQQTTGAMVRGLRPKDFLARDLLRDSLIMGGTQSFEANEGILIGAPLAQALAVVPGDSITLIAPQGQTTVFGTVPRVQSFKISGIFEIGMYEYDSGIVFMPFALAQEFFKQGRNASALELLVDNPSDIKAVRGAIMDVLPRPMEIVDWQDRNISFFTAIEVERNVMFLILTLIILVAGFNIISMLIILVKDKQSDIAILRAMGATRANILRIFILNGFTLGFIGTAAGFVLGLLFVRNIEAIRRGLEALTGTNLFSPEIYFLSKLPAKMDGGEVMMVVLMALVISLLSTLYPAWRASKAEPARVLRHD